MPVGSNLLNLLSSSFHFRHFTVLRLVRHSRHPVAALSSEAVSHIRLHFVPKPLFWSRVANQFHTEAVATKECNESLTSFPVSNKHPWPEWSKLVGLLVEKGYSDRCLSSGEDDDSFLVDEDLSDEFLMAAKACLGFARDRPDILRLLTKKNIEAVVLNGSPFLFKNGENSTRRMKMFFTGEGSSQESEIEKAQTIDVMRYLLSYAYGPLSSCDASGLKSNELVERSVQKLLGELFNLSGTVWKSKSVDATLTELPSSNEQFRPPGQYTDMKSDKLIYPELPVQSSVTSESRSSALNSLVNAEYRKSMIHQKQGPEESSSSRSCVDSYNNISSAVNMNQTNGLSKLNINFNSSSPEFSSSLLDKNVESINRAQTSGKFNANSAESSTYSSQPPSHLGNNYSHTYYGDYSGKPNQPWTNNATLYGGSTLKSSAPNDNSWSHQLTSDSRDNVKSTPPFSNSSNINSSSVFYGGPSATSSSSPGNSWTEYRTSQGGYNINSTPPSSNSWSTDTYGAQTETSSQPPSNSWNNSFSHAGQHLNSTQPSSNSSWSNKNTFYGGPTMNSSRPPSDSGSSYNTSYVGKNANSTQPWSNSWDDNNRSYGGSAPNSSQPSFSDYRSDYNTRYDELVPKSTRTSSNSGISDSTSCNGFTEKSTQPWSNSLNHRNTSYSGPTTNSSQPPSNSWNNYNANTTPNSWNINNSYVGSAADSNQGYTVNSTYPSSNSWNSTSASSIRGASANPTQPSDRNSWNNKGENWSGRFPRANNVSEGLPTEGQTHNTHENGSYGYSGKSLEGSCVKELDPLDMSEEAKAERWFRRAAQIKDISELSQIPDEDFPQIMPMRKGVNRFVVSKRKTPLERRLASQQYKRNFPVVSSEPEKDPTVGESNNKPLF